MLWNGFLRVIYKAISQAKDCLPWFELLRYLKI